MRRVFADTFYYIALLNENDEAHADAMRVTPRMDTSIITTVWVLTEVADALCGPSSRSRVVQFISDLRRRSSVKIAPLSVALFDEGFNLYSERPDKAWSLTDCISFVVMEREGLTDVLTADHHFEQAGFNVLMKLSP